MVGERGASPSGNGPVLYFGLFSVARRVTFLGYPRKQRSVGDLRSLGETTEWRGNLATRSTPWLNRRLRQAGSTRPLLGAIAATLVVSEILRHLHGGRVHQMIDLDLLGIDRQLALRHQQGVSGLEPGFTEAK